MVQKCPANTVVLGLIDRQIKQFKFGGVDRLCRVID
jgi:hypothetical protein